MLFSFNHVALASSVGGWRLRSSGQVFVVFKGVQLAMQFGEVCKLSAVTN